MRTKSEINQAAFRQLQPSIDQSYPHGNYVAIDGGRIVANAADISELKRVLADQGLDLPCVLVVQAGHSYPEYMDILF